MYIPAKPAPTITASYVAVIAADSGMVWTSVILVTSWMCRIGGCIRGGGRCRCNAVEHPSRSVRQSPADVECADMVADARRRTHVVRLISAQPLVTLHVDGRSVGE